MAWKGPWGCFIHIPKTSGKWTMRVLAQLGEGGRDGKTHSFPKVWAHPRYFTIVREPTDWLRSVFCDRVKSRWQEHPHEGPWAEFCKIVMPYRTEDFEKFVDSITTKEIGVVGWLYGCYTPPKVKAIRYGKDQIKFLEKLGCHPEIMMPVNVSKDKPEITEEIWYKIYLAEHDTYGEYNWAPNGRYLDEI